jgi:hypothetical protein
MTMAAALQSGVISESETPATPILRARIEHPSAWTVADFLTPADYAIELSASHQRDIERARTPTFDWRPLTSGRIDHGIAVGQDVAAAAHRT